MKVNENSDLQPFSYMATCRGSKTLQKTLEHVREKCEIGNTEKEFFI